MKTLSLGKEVDTLGSNTALEIIWLVSRKI